jgi:hypothetical protein
MTSGDCTVYELRQYTLHPGTADAFVHLFETHLVETQEAVGMRLLGQFRDLDRPDAFVWMRGFADMQRRQEALAAFYGGPDWAAHSHAANSMMIDSDDVLLLEPIRAGDSLAQRLGPRPPVGATPTGSAHVEIVVYSRPRDDPTEGLTDLEALEREAGGEPLPALLTLPPRPAAGRPLRERHRSLHRRRRPRRSADQGPVPLDEPCARAGPLDAGVLARHRQQLAAELVNGLQRHRKAGGIAATACMTGWSYAAWARTVTDGRSPPAKGST